MKYLITIILIIASSLACLSQNKAGTTAAEFLTIPVGARATALGGAFVAIADDATAIYWNPGGLSRMKDNEVTFTHSRWLIDTNLEWFSIAVKLTDNDAIGLSFYQLDYGEEEVTTVYQPEGTNEMWTAVDLCIGVLYSRNLTDRFSFGGSVKYIQQKIWNEKANAFAFDVGLLFYTELTGFRIGMSLSNFGTNLKLKGKDLLFPYDIDESHTGNNANITGKLETDAWELPLTFRVGAAYDIFNVDNVQLILASDVVVPNNQNTNLNIGSEFLWNELLSLRGGYYSLFKKDAVEGVTVGIGVNYELDSWKVKLDFGYMRYEKFSDVIRYSMSINF